MTGPLFKLVLQHHRNDCGVACLATLMQKSYAEVLNIASQFNPRVLKNGLFASDLVRIAAEFGVELKRRTQRIDLDEHTGIVGLSFPKGAEHWVFVANGLLFDPDENGNVWDSYTYVRSYKGKISELLEER